MKLSTIRTIKQFCHGLHSEPCWREVLENILDGETNFEVDNVRFITDDTILRVLADELVSDDYLLGCFSALFIAGQTDWPIALIEAAQKGGEYEALGQAVAENCDMEAFAEAYASVDGYGHHFNHYDSSEEELNVNGVLFHVFDNH